MKEKKRYEIHIYDDNGVLDKSINDTYKLEKLLNQQSRRIKELEEELDEVKRDYIPKLEFGLKRANKMGRDAEKENQQLKQQLHDLPKKLVADIKMQMGSIEDILINCGNGKEDALCWFNECLDSILKKYGDVGERICQK